MRRGDKIKVLFAGLWLDAFVTQMRDSSYAVQPDHVQVRIPSKPYGNYQIPVRDVRDAS